MEMKVINQLINAALSTQLNGVSKLNSTDAPKDQRKNVACDMCGSLGIIGLDGFSIPSGAGMMWLLANAKPCPYCN
ncbi:TPA: hypothetical protein ACQWM0_002302 [Yersinia enterocolitica]